MRFICDAPAGRTWYRMETEAEAAQESQLMGHAVEKHFRRAQEEASQSFTTEGIPYIEQDIRRSSHITRVMPIFATLRDADGVALVTAMLPSAKGGAQAFRPIVVGRDNSDPYPAHSDAIDVLAQHFGVTLDRTSYPYRRR
jgi:hypothetical protein